MGRAKIANRKIGEGADRKAGRRWLIISNETGQDITGINPAKYPDKATRGISEFDRACDRASNLVVSTTLVPAWEYYGIPDPEEGEE